MDVGNSGIKNGAIAETSVNKYKNDGVYAIRIYNSRFEAFSNNLEF